VIGYMPQRDMLLPWRTVLGNVTLPLEYRGMGRRAARRIAADILFEFGLHGFEQAWPSTLSGGMRQRVAFARTVVTGRRALLLDEPFGALDALTRLDMQHWLLGVWDRMRATVILVTHDLEEAVHLADRVYVMSGSPGMIRAEVAITLARPRSPDVIASPAFARLKGAILAALRSGPAGITL
jgi:ABC-type nitrate/sulfonate/bicarbonate transport system ATPase subunit